MGSRDDGNNSTRRGGTKQGEGCSSDRLRRHGGLRRGGLSDDDVDVECC